MPTQDKYINITIIMYHFVLILCVQVFDVHNSGDTAVSYTVDTRPLDDLQTSNYLMSILKCLQPQGEVPSGCSVALEFVFSPLEAKKYTVSTCSDARARGTSL